MRMQWPKAQVNKGVSVVPGRCCWVHNPASAFAASRGTRRWRCCARERSTRRAVYARGHQTRASACPHLALAEYVHTLPVRARRTAHIVLLLVLAPPSAACASSTARARRVGAAQRAALASSVPRASPHAHTLGATPAPRCSSSHPRRESVSPSPRSATHPSPHALAARARREESVLRCASLSHLQPRER
ncbi:hypothetical protein DFH09DRAFT_1318437 [Mycena vulgaris]|nr:hypothetical protein DFH09DRAFT_1318437 [Mycena vulgaris]